MDEQVVERIIRRISYGFGYRFPNECYRCGRGFEAKLINALERSVIDGYTLIESIKDIKYDPVRNNYWKPEDPYYSSELPPAIGPKDICCRLSLVSPFIYPTGTNIYHKQTKKVVGTTTKINDPDSIDLFDYIENEAERPEMVVDEEHGDVRLYIEDGIPGFELPIVWDEL